MTIEPLIGQTATSVTVNDDKDVLTFHLNDGRSVVFWHEQDCCESVGIEDIAGNLDDLVGTPILQADEESNSGDETDAVDSCTWTFYRFATVKGGVVVRWYGESNGYYSESVEWSVHKAGERTEE